MIDLVKLHLGCGKVILPGFVNMDARQLEGVDIVTDVFTLPTVEKNSVDLIYASHIFEHVPRPDTKKVLTRWYDVLKPGGTLRLAVPNFLAIVEQYNEKSNLKELLGLLYGRQDYPGNAHMCTYDMWTLHDLLVEVGFPHPRRYDWHDTEHADVDDCSQSFLPHLDKIYGRLMSLNMEARKPK